jgi:energy-converting hydrogenase Eha subunit A
VEANSHAVEATSHAVEATSHAVEATSHSAEATSHSAEATSHSVEATSHSAEATSHTVEATSQRDEGFKYRNKAFIKAESVQILIIYKQFKTTQMKKVKEMPKSANMLIILIAVMTKTVIKRVIAALNIDKLKQIGPFIAKAKLIRQSLKGNTWFPAPPVPVADNAQFDNDIKALDAAEITALTRAIGAVQSRDDKKAIVLNDIHLLQAYVQSVADANPKNAQSIIISSGLDEKHTGSRNKEAISVKPKKGESGTMAVSVKKVEGTLANLWEYSADGGVTWIDMDATAQGKTTITGLAPGSKIIVRHRPILRKGKGEWISSAATIVI